ncbi:hypothetical protein, partial [Enterobacter hormaechei]|uniref:hypothetical protein n=1 Tax=Enterobacter hormaechei TaxID=158836 RepID=UPI001BE4D571
MAILFIQKCAKALLSNCFYCVFNYFYNRLKHRAGAGECDLTHYMKAVLSMQRAEMQIYSRILIWCCIQCRIKSLFFSPGAIN